MNTHRIMAEAKRTSPCNAGNNAEAHKSIRIDIVTDFRAAMLAAGIITDNHITADSTLHRIHIDGHRPGSRNGAYILHGDSKPAGWFMDFKTGVTGTWNAGGGHWHMDEATRQWIEAGKRQRKAEIETKHGKTALKAQAIWNAATPCTDHPYLTRKGVKAHGLRVSDWVKWTGEPGNWRSIVVLYALLVPLRDAEGKLWNLQAIFTEPHLAFQRDNDFMSGGRKAGLFHVIGEESPVIMVCEGYATGASIHAMTGRQAGLRCL